MLRGGSLRPAVRLELPFAPVHAQDCAGICPVCGCNRNVESCSCEGADVESGPFAALKTLFDDDPDIR